MKYLLKYHFVWVLNFLTLLKSIVILEGKNKSTTSKAETPKGGSKGG